MTVATAPGKLVRFGDYAVLRGAPAAATAVDVRARAKVEVTDATDSVFIDLAAGEAHGFVVEPGVGVRWLGDSPERRGAIVEAVLNTCHELVHLKGSLPGLRISMNTDAFFTSVDGKAVKLGLGSSAALSVALTGALLSALNIEVGQDSLLNVCYAVHRAFQSGQGSGIDVAAALLGGTVGVHRIGEQSDPVAGSLVWPEGLLMRAVWSGTSASTPELLSRFDNYGDTHADEFARHLRRLTRVAQQADAAWRAGDVVELLSSLAGYDDALCALDYDAGIGVNTDVHDRLRGLTESHGAVYKTSGAGGGDFGTVFTDSEQVMTAVIGELAGAGFMLLDQEADAAGLVVRA